MEGFHYMIKGPIYVNFVGKSLPIQIEKAGKMKLTIRKCSSEEFKAFWEGRQEWYGKLGMFMSQTNNFFEISYSLKNGIDSLTAFESLFQLAVYIVFQSALTSFDHKSSTSPMRGRTTIKEVHDEFVFLRHNRDLQGEEIIKKKQEKRSELNEEKEILQMEIDNIKFSQDEFQKIYNDAKTIIANPLAIRDLQDVEIKQLLIRVCFNNKIYYTKNQGLHTPEISLIYSLFAQVSDGNSPNVEMAGVEPASERHYAQRLPL